MATCIRRCHNAFRGFTLNALSLRTSTRNDNPYGTLTFGPVTSAAITGAPASTALGKVAILSTTQRIRAGFYFAIPNFSGTPSVVKVTLQTQVYVNDLESFLPALYSSNTDDSAFGAGWQNHVNNLIGYGVADNSLRTQTFTFPFTSGMKGTNISFIFGQQYELLGTGAGVAASPPYYSSYMDLYSIYNASPSPHQQNINMVFA